MRFSAVVFHFFNARYYSSVWGFKFNEAKAHRLIVLNIFILNQIRRGRIFIATSNILTFTGNS